MKDRERNNRVKNNHIDEEEKLTLRNWNIDLFGHQPPSLRPLFRSRTSDCVVYCTEEREKNTLIPSANAKEEKQLPVPVCLCVVCVCVCTYSYKVFIWKLLFSYCERLLSFFLVPIRNSKSRIFSSWKTLDKLCNVEFRYWIMTVGTIEL